MLKPGFGLKDAPRLWAMMLDHLLRKAGCVPTRVDQKLYLLWDPTRKCLRALISTHVDDLKMAGDEDAVQHILKVLEEKVGKLTVQREKFDHTGIAHLQHKDGTIEFGQNHYIEQLRRIDDSETRGQAENTALSSELTSAFLSLLGGISWVVQTRLDVAVYVNALQRAAKAPAVKHLRRLNRLLRWLQRRRSVTVFRKLREPLKLTCVSDAAFRREDTTGLSVRLRDHDL